jgi:DNA-binding response OmpR family regulator
LCPSTERQLLGPPPQGTGRPLVLLAEDSPDVQGVVRHALEADGCEVRVAADGEEALALLANMEPDLLVLDLMMPRLSGLDVLTALQQSGRLERLPVLVLTARSGEDDVVACLKMGAADYVTKPFMLRELRARANALLARSRGRAAEDGPGGS